MQLSLFTVATLVLAPLAAMAAPAPEPVPNVNVLPEGEFRNLVKRGYCSKDSECGSTKCLCQLCYGGPIQCFKVCC
ncbi:hypothetical protein H072_1189 [Dactylellina haptotyla CBS 200.50]|uniref:Invertebrate defensins family profile domain-containing protein n=1 Tax=Dactylellina haptotyla (strain CBS 200.50) TaxID=1284197 RepID=S8APJ0_DACHA|nr:hypothetical protein H072_1189 [Dactylellina haptotyla CBS 200.50]